MAKNSAPQSRPDEPSPSPPTVVSDIERATNDPRTVVRVEQFFKLEERYQQFLERVCNQVARRFKVDPHDLQLRASESWQRRFIHGGPFEVRQGEKPGMFRGYLRRIVSNAARKMLSGRDRGFGGEQDLLQQVGDDDPIDATDRRIDNLIKLEAVRDAVDELYASAKTDVQRRNLDLFVAVEMNGQDRQLVAERHGVNVPHLNVALNRVREQIRQTLTDRGLGEPELAEEDLNRLRQSR